jgi:hypothetical protein
MASERAIYEPIARERARAYGIDPDTFVRQITQESGWLDDVIHCRRASSAGALGIAQIVARWHPGVDPCDPPAALDYAAWLMATYVKYHGSYARALAAYNWGSGNVASWDGRRSTLPGETRTYLDVILGSGWPEPGATHMPVKFDPNYPASIQDDNWSCAPTSLDWAMRSLGRTPGEGWIEADMVAMGYVSTEQGLLDASGAGIVSWLGIDDALHYGSEGYGASNNQGTVAWDALVAEVNPHPPYPVLIGGRAWGHWSGVRGFDAATGCLLLANPAPNWQGVGQEMSRDEFDRWGPFSMVRVIHPDLLAAPVPAPVPPAPPAPAPPPPGPPEPQPAPPAPVPPPPVPPTDDRDRLIAAYETALRDIRDRVLPGLLEHIRHSDEHAREIDRICRQMVGDGG